MVCVLLIFGANIPYFLDIFISKSDIIGKGTFIPVELYMFFIHAKCDGVLSIDKPINEQFLFLNSDSICEKAINSVVQTGVKSPWMRK